MSAHSNPSKVVVLGGGYAGTLAANRLRGRRDTDVVLVNPRPRFVERIRLHQYLARTGNATLDYGTLLGEGVRLVVDRATRIDAAARTVRLASGGDLEYDYLVYAVGSTSAVPASVPGAVEFAWPVAEWRPAACRPRSRSQTGVRAALVRPAPHGPPASPQAPSFTVT
ncbi:FAD-dependent oxidoreductase [Streptomyces griseosporeus]|uniref:FAD-dependent oxidoreductase n=1 Tax=Streptomyces griseosporeus TaxID=1910 RepID=UPI0036FBA68D